MNIYLVVEDGESHCIKAKTMHEAIEICHISHLEEMKDHYKEQYNECHESKYYYDEILESCSLVGKLAN